MLCKLGLLGMAMEPDYTRTHKDAPPLPPSPGTCSAENIVLDMSLWSHIVQTNIELLRITYFINDVENFC